METAVLRGATEALSQGFISGFCSPSILWESLRTWERSQVTAKPINLLNVYPLNPFQDPPGLSLCHDHLCVQNFALRSVQFKCMLKLITVRFRKKCSWFQSETKKSYAKQTCLVSTLYVKEPGCPEIKWKSGQRRISLSRRTCHRFVFCLFKIK